MTRTVAELAALVGARLDGDGSLVITGVAPIEIAGLGQITFLANPKYAGFLKSTRAAAVVIPPTIDGHAVTDGLVPAGVALLVHDSPYSALAKLLDLYHPAPLPPMAGVESSAVIGLRVLLSDRVHVGPNCVIEDDVVLGDGATILAGTFIGRKTTLGADCLIGPNVTILAGCTIGSRVRIHPAAVIGADGFGYATVGAKHEKIPQVGGVTIGDDVEIGAGTTIDCATMGQTVIGRGTKIDNLVQIGHNVQIGEDCIIVALAGISGSTKIGNRVTIAGQVGITGHLEIGDGATIGAQSGVHKPIPPNSIWLGSPANDIALQKRIFAAINSLPEYVKTIRALEKRLAALERKPNPDRA